MFFEELLKSFRLKRTQVKVRELIRRGDAANLQRRWQEAERAYGEALRQRPDLAHVWVQYGHALKEQGEFEKAETAYRKAIVFSPDEADTHLQLGHVLKLLSRQEEAKGAYGEALKLDASLLTAAEEINRLERRKGSTPLGEISGQTSRTIRVPFDPRLYAKITDIDETDAFEHYIAGGVSLLTTDQIAYVLQKRCDAKISVLNDHYRQIMEPHFDNEFYWSRYHDIDPGNVDALEHFYYQGWREKRDPNANFSVAYYLHAYPEVRTAELNPYLYHLLFGSHLGYRTAKSTAVNTPRFRRNSAAFTVTPSAHTVSASDIHRYAELEEAPLKPLSSYFDAEALNIHWVVPDFSVGSGGHMTIFRICNLLESRGHQITIWIRDPRFHESPKEARDTLHKYFQHLAGPIKFVSDKIGDAAGDIIVATDAFSVPIVVAMSRFKRRFYFVQDFEAAFYPMGTRYLLAEMTYQLDLDCICAGPWLEGMMRDRYGRWSRKFWLAADAEDYKPVKNGVRARRQRIAFYARLFTDRRAVELGLLALEILASRGIDIHVDFFGQEDLPFLHAPYSAKNHGVCDSWELAEIYSRCDVGVVFSSTNYSIVGQEMMACGLPVIDLAVESTQATYPEGVIRLARPGPKAIAAAIEDLLSDDSARREQIRKAAAWVGTLSWTRSGELVESAFVERLKELDFINNVSVKKKDNYFVTVAIPTRNGGSILQKVIEKVKSQQTPGKIQILCIDSSSEDGTNEYLRNAQGVDLITIPQREFQHGATRNFAVREARSEFVAFLTQDAIPVGNTWLYNLVSVLKSYPGSGAAFGRHVAHDCMSDFIKRDIHEHFKSLDVLPIYVDPSDKEVRDGFHDLAFRQKLHFFSDNNSCLKKEVWREIPIPNVDFGEDQLFAFELLRRGYGRVYARNAKVYHSHDDPPDVVEERAYIEARFFYEHFGYTTLITKSDAVRRLYELNSADTEYARLCNITDSELQRRLLQNRARVEGQKRAMQELGLLVAKSEEKGTTHFSPAPSFGVENGQLRQSTREHSPATLRDLAYK